MVKPMSSTNLSNQLLATLIESHQQFIKQQTELHQHFMLQQQNLQEKLLLIGSEKNLQQPQEKSVAVKYEMQIFDPGKERWILDHRPNYVLPAIPMMSMVDLMGFAASKYFPGKKLIALENIQILAWAIIDKPAIIHFKITLQNAEKAEVILSLEKDQQVNAFAKGIVKFANSYPQSPNIPRPLAETTAVINPYSSLFHGPAFQIMQSLVRGTDGASSILNAENHQVPFGCLNQVLLDGAVQCIPHDNLTLWSNDIGIDQAGYPALIPTFECFSEPPHTGLVHCEARFIGFHHSKRFPKFDITLLVDRKVWLKFLLIDALFPKGRLGLASAENRRAFLQHKQYIPGLQLSRTENKITYLTTDEVKNSDWISGSIAALYEVQGNLAEITQQVAIKEHLAQRLKVHPAEIIVHNNNTASWKQAPEKIYEFVIEKRDNEFSICRVDQARSADPLFG
jgi:hypothetical protein